MEGFGYGDNELRSERKYGTYMQQKEEKGIYTFK